MSKVSFFGARTSAFWPKNCDISRAARKVFMTSSIVFNLQREYKQQDKSESLRKKYIVLVAAWASQLQKSQFDPRFINASPSYKGGLKKEMDEICPKTPARFQTYLANLEDFDPVLICLGSGDLINELSQP